MRQIQIVPLQAEGVLLFLAYLNDHLSDNGREQTPLFQPLSPSDSKVSDAMQLSFATGLTLEIDEVGWRRVWVARNELGNIVGHIDLRAHRERHTSHRALLGMGVDRNHRRQGIGRLLMETAFEWANREAKLGFIDLQVLSQNQPAIKLYEKIGFRVIGEIEDMFRIEGNSYSYTLMCKVLQSNTDLD